MASPENAEQIDKIQNFYDRVNKMDSEGHITGLLDGDIDKMVFALGKVLHILKTEVSK